MNHPEHGEVFRIDLGGELVRLVVPRRGTPYEHRCDLDVFQAIAHAIDDLEGKPFTMEKLRAAENVPWTQTAVAVGFLKERGCVVPSHGRKHVAASGGVHLDAMTEYHALRELGQSD